MARKLLFLSLYSSILMTSATMIYASAAYASSLQPSYDDSQSLPQLTAEQIAADVQAKFDPLTGRTEYIAQDFDPFEDSSQMAGSAVLRSASSGISRDGATISGGAYLDIAVLYTSASRDPYDSKGYEHAVYLNGQPVDVMTYDVQTMDCTRDITKVTYDDGYYRGDNYGYVGGMYRLYPRYRGHSHYYNHFDRIRYGAWRGTRHHYYGNYGYDHRHGNHYSDRNRQDGRAHRDSGNRNNDSRDVRRDIDAERNRERVEYRNREVPNLSHRIISTHNIVRPDMLGDRRLSGGAVSDRPAKETQRQTILQPVKRPITGRTWSNPATPRRVSETSRSAVIRPDRPNERRFQEAPSRDTRANSRRETIVTPSRSTSRPVNRANTATRPVSRPVVSRTETRSRPAPIRTAPPRLESRARPKPQSRPRPQSRPKPQARPTSRRVDRAFKTKNKTSSRPFRYYPGNYTQSATYVDARCVKEERLSLHIPAERLDAARFDGLSLVLLDRHGQDVPIYIPPNYIDGFKRANPYLNPSYYPSKPNGSIQPYGDYPQSGG